MLCQEQGRGALALLECPRAGSTAPAAKRQICWSQTGLICHHHVESPASRAVCCLLDKSIKHWLGQLGLWSVLLEFRLKEALPKLLLHSSAQGQLGLFCCFMCGWGAVSSGNVWSQVSSAFLNCIQEWKKPVNITMLLYSLCKSKFLCGDLIFFQPFWTEWLKGLLWMEWMHLYSLVM